MRPKEEFLCAPLLYEMFEVLSLFYSFEFFEFKDVAEGFCEVRRIQQLSRNPWKRMPEMSSTTLPF